MLTQCSISQPYTKAHYSGNRVDLLYNQFKLLHGSLPHPAVDKLFKRKLGLFYAYRSKGRQRL